MSKGDHRSQNTLHTRKRYIQIQHYHIIISHVSYTKVVIDAWLYFEFYAFLKNHKAKDPPV